MAALMVRVRGRGWVRAEIQARGRLPVSQVSVQGTVVYTTPGVEPDVCMCLVRGLGWG